MSRSSSVQSMSMSEESSNDVGDNESSGVGLSASSLNYEMRRKLDIMKKLHNTGVQVDIDLPQIAVIGNQSAGKSSLIEAVSGITLPRASGTCTRCPTECHLTRTDAPWQCIVSLRITTDSNGKPLGQVRNEQFGDIIYDKSQVEDRIRRAQRAILNPQQSLDLQFFLNEREDDINTKLTKQLAFSLNCITLSISGPDVADLSFCDLPGLIASVARGGEDSSIALVEKMVVSYIKKPSCIILLTVACETDFENQGAHRLAKQYDPEGKRTVGVLTKPDRIPQGEESSWIPFIRDEREPLENNWFCVKLLSSFQLNMKLSWAQSRQLEEDFFSKKPGPWSEIEEPYRKYLGTENLVERLSTVLSDLISSRMPEIQDELEKSIASTRELLSRLAPPPSTDPRSEILTLLHMFVQDVSQSVKGVSEGFGLGAPSGLIQSITPEQENFKRAIRATAPEFWPFETRVLNGKLPPADFLHGEEQEDTREGFASSKAVASPKICLDEVNERIKKARTRELPDHMPPIVVRTYIQNIVKQWDAPSDALVKSTYNIVSAHLKQMVRDHFHQFGQGKLEQQIRGIVQAHINACHAKAEQHVKYQRKLEQKWPFTMNTHYYRDYKAKFLAQYKSAREEHAKNAKAPLKITFPQPPSTNTTAFGTTIPRPNVFGDGTSNTISFKPIEPAESSKSTPVAEANHEAQTKTTSSSEADDRNAAALEIMAAVRAYFQVAYKRFIDYVPLTIDAELVDGLAQDLLPTLYSQLGINGPKGDAICKDFAQENRKTATRRVELTKKLERLMAGHNELFAAFV
ncbi:Interferon-induced GTP-binding protein Mx2 [Psilocybe cubensis]|uniref:P-loop containing nucleoside triphosphate hydrolase protein n=2 Tax=Psilocybe cubensis TaxID=181762 RepID=A0A8H7XUK0_PSICU|nr:Interferon-induced GTP-binding protein Mx2 [Psilocybe cubensis]KAH9474808.1 Interferon-induced GTP-binding protein Mx2 [Psilocybe cubensis]